MLCIVINQEYLHVDVFILDILTAEKSYETICWMNFTTLLGYNHLVVLVSHIVAWTFLVNS